MAPIEPLDLPEMGDKFGDEVEIFAKFLDECILPRGSVSEQRHRIFKLVDNYYAYARETADVLHERLRLDRLARGSSGDSGDSTSSISGARTTGLLRSEAMTLDEPLSLSPAAAAQGGGESNLEASALRWEEEAQTWDLVRRLLPLRFRDRAAAAEKKTTGDRQSIHVASSSSSSSANKPPRTRREYWADFVLSEPKARERKTVLEWLQSSAGHNGPAIDDVVQELQRHSERGEIVAHGWLHTRGAIKQHKRLLGTSEALDPSSPDVVDSNLDAPVRLVTQLDPDVVTRQAGRKLAPQDAFFEQAIWLGCYELLRRGRSMAEIRDWCVERTEVWRAASISALPLSNSSMHEDGDGDREDDGADFDCLATILWRRMCYKLAQTGSAGAYERAVYGMLSGDRTSVEAVAKSWDDLTFAKVNAELRAQFDAYLMRQADAAAVHSLLLLHGDVPTGYALEKAAAASSSFSSRDRDERVRRAAHTPAKALQAALLDEKLDHFLFQQGMLLAEDANAERASKLIPQYEHAVKPGSHDSSSSSTKPVFVQPTDYHGLRILAHVLIVVSALDRLDGKGKDAATLGPLARRHQTEEHIVASYISFLRLARLEELIPLYASKLLGERCYTNMALNLIHVEERDMQLHLLQLMRKLGLDVVQFVQTLPQLFLADVDDRPGVCPARATFSMLQDGAPSLKYGRMIKPRFFGPAADNNNDDADDLVLVDKTDELLIRSMEWMLLVDGLVRETCDFGVRIYKYFLKHEHLTAARVLASRVSCADVIRLKTPFGSDLPEEIDPSWWEEVFGGAGKGAIVDTLHDEVFELEGGGGGGGGDGDGGLTKNEVSVHARPLYELECLVNALDCLETTAMLAASMAQAHAAPGVSGVPGVPGVSATDPARDRNVAKSMDDNAKILRGYMRPLLDHWLQHGVDEDDGNDGNDGAGGSEQDADVRLLRETYLPQVVIGFASTLQFAGTTSSRDYLLECMELASVVAAPDSDVAGVLVQTGRMKELVEALASCSKALAIWTSDVQKGPGASSKKMRELGWSRELWSVKSVKQ